VYCVLVQNFRYLHSVDLIIYRSFFSSLYKYTLCPVYISVDYCYCLMFIYIVSCLYCSSVCLYCSSVCLYCSSVCLFILQYCVSVGVIFFAELSFGVIIFMYKDWVCIILSQ